MRARRHSRAGRAWRERPGFLAILFLSFSVFFAILSFLAFSDFLALMSLRHSSWMYSIAFFINAGHLEAQLTIRSIRNSNGFGGEISFANLLMVLMAGCDLRNRIGPQ